MGSEKLSTHPSGKKTSAAHFEHLPTRRLVYNSSLQTLILLQFEYHLMIHFENRFNRTFYRVASREAIASKKSAGLGHPS